MLKYYENNNENIVKREGKWHDKLNLNLGLINWDQLYKLNISLNYDNNLKFFHFLILKFNLFTNDQAHHARGGLDLCYFCQNVREDTYHLLYECNIVFNFYNEVFDSFNYHRFQVDRNNLNILC